jgi:hypothetical protein
MGSYELNMTGSTPSMSLDVSVNNQSALKPGPLLSSGSVTNWTYTVTNTGNTTLNNIEITGKQKLPSVGSWQSLCSIAAIQPGATGTCSTTETAISEIYKALIVARGTGAGNTVEDSSQAFYFGQTAVSDPRLDTKRNITLDVLEAKGFDQATYDALLAEINAATSVSELHAIIVRMRSGNTNPPSNNSRLDTKRNIALGVLEAKGFDATTYANLLAEINAATSVSELHAIIVHMRSGNTNPPSNNSRLDTKRNIALGVLEAKGFDQVTYVALLAEINAATSVSELHSIIVRMRSGNVSTTPQLALTLVVTANGLDIDRPGASIPAGSAVNWTYTVTNDGNADLHNIVITQRQKLPTLGEWATPCVLTIIAPGATESCSATTTAITDNYKALIVARSTLDNGDNVEDKVDAFYRH